MSEGIRVKSSIDSLRGLVEEVKEGRLRVPRFHRSFSWSNAQMADLFDSVARGYPIGSLFVWNTKGDQGTSGFVGPFQQPMRSVDSLVSLVIDGQHRLVTLVGVLLAHADAEERWRLYYDCEEDRFCHAAPGRAPAPRWVLVSTLFGTLGVLQESRRLFIVDPQRAPLWVERIERVARALVEYQIPVIAYNGDLDSAVEVFSRLNRTGKGLGADELLSALTYREGDSEEFRLADRIDSIREQIVAMGFGAVGRHLVLRAIFVAAGMEPHSRDWSYLVKYARESPNIDWLEEAVDGARRGLMGSVAFLRTQGILSLRQLPYGMQLVALSAYFGVNESPSAREHALLSRMLWVSSFSAWFGPPAQERALVRELRSMAAGAHSGDSLSAIDLDTPALPMPSQVDQRSARVRALVNVLVAQKPCDLQGAPLGASVGPLFLAQEASVLTRIFARGASSLLASPANRVINVTHIGGIARPWLRSIDDDHRDQVLRSLAIDPDTFTLLQDNDADGFLSARIDYLDRLEREFMKARGVTPPKLGAKPAPSPIDTDD